MKNLKLLNLSLIVLAISSCAYNNKTSDDSFKSDDISSSQTSSDDTSLDSSADSEPIPSQNESLPIGNTSVSGPNNLSNPVDISDYTNFTFNSYMPDNFTYIQGNHKLGGGLKGDYYADGSFKFQHLYYGFQTALFNSWNKLEVRLEISQVTNSSKKADKSEDSFMHVYGYNNKGHYIYKHDLKQGQLSANTKEIKFYIENQPEISYLEFRLNAYPYKGSQCYNFGVSNLMMHGWPIV